ncbi:MULTISPECIES: hypothetical protein [unclassified Haloarcula]|uniref:hypothetical protein n=1 Tax=unclassified Haloarcula TaxID=2624677 RepID=UPI0011C477D7|nr:MULTISPECIES: hypothetical protein [unclassified Haloarcula]
MNSISTTYGAFVAVLLVVSVLTSTAGVGVVAASVTTDPGDHYYQQQESPDGNTTETPTSTPTSEGGDSANSDDSNTTNDPSNWSKARILSIVDDQISRHSTIDVDSMETWYLDNQDQFSDVEQRYVEAWIDWYETGEKPGEGLHPSLITEAENELQNASQNSQNAYGLIDGSNITASDLDREGTRITSDVEVVAWSFDESDNAWTGIIRVSGGTTESVQYVDFGSMASTGRYTAQSVELEPGTHTIRLPAGEFEGIQLITLASGDTGVVLREIEPPFLSDMRSEYLWIVLVSGSAGMALFALQWFLGREQIFQRFRPAAALIAGQVERESLLNRFTDSQKEPEEYDDGLRGLFQRYANIRSVVVNAVKLGAILYLVDMVGLIALPLPDIGDQAKLVIGSILFAMIFFGPALLKPILRAAYNPSLEKIQVLDETGRKVAGYWARKGTFSEDYQYDRYPPTRDTETGDTAYLVQSINRGEQRVEAAFDWQVETVEDIEGIEREQVEYINGQLIGIDQILADRKKAAMVIKDMLTEAKNGKQLRSAFPFVRARTALDEAKNIAIGLNRAVSGDSVEAILDDMIDSYESKEDELEDQFARETDLDGDLDDYAGELTRGNRGGDAEESADNAGDSDE